MTVRPNPRSVGVAPDAASMRRIEDFCRRILAAQEALDTPGTAGLAAETAARIAADTTEASTRAAADSAEATARAAADTAETAARIAGDATLAGTKLDDWAAPDDNTDLNVSTSAHGLVPKAPNNTLKFLRGDGSWATPSGSAGGNWCPDATPDSPHADDEEFDGNSIPSGWSRHDPNTLLTDTYADGFAKLATTSNATQQIRGIYRACPAAGDWSIWASADMQVIPITGTTFACGLFLSENSNPATGKLFTCDLVMNGLTQMLALCQTWTTYNSGAATVGNALTVPAMGYVRIGYDGTSFFTYWSTNGRSWIRMHIIAKTFTPVSAGLFVQNNTGNTAYGLFDFYRVKAASGASGINAGLFQGKRI